MIPKEPKKQLKNWAIFSGLAIQMGVLVYLAARGGAWLDARYNEGGKAFMVVLILAAVGGSLFLILKQANRMNS
ncbi:AtpZ/AtpI family protein [Croceiramulus getboli]|nr:AtpZ/AtpI family protein [Flavobacteriaceae bacterium YJPT1-3]